MKRMTAVLILAATVAVAAACLGWGSDPTPTPPATPATTATSAPTPTTTPKPRPWKVPKHADYDLSNLTPDELAQICDAYHRRGLNWNPRDRFRFDKYGELVFEINTAHVDEEWPYTEAVIRECGPTE